MSFIPLAEGKHGCVIAVAPSARDGLSHYLSQPKRPLAALLNRQRMECRADGTFLYRSRPFQLVRFEIRPEVVFTAGWTNDQLRIVFLRSQINGLGAVERAIQFRCEAVLQPCADGLEAHVRASILMDENHAMAVVPLTWRCRWADQALQLVFERLERRCQGGLKRSMNRWLEASAPL